MISKIEEVFQVMVESRVGKEVEPYPYQKEVFRAFEKLSKGEREVVVIQAPCGSGKTEAIMAPYLSQYVTREVTIPRLVYAAPTQTLLYNMENRFRDYVSALAKKYGEFCKLYGQKLKPKVEHGLDVDPNYLVPRFNIATYDVVAHAWMARRAVPLRPFTTRGALLTSLLVFDEAHLIQDLYTYSQRVFPELVAAMAKSGIPIAIVSATIPRQIVDFIIKGIGKEYVEVVKADNLSLQMGSLSVEPLERGEPYLEVREALDEVKERVLKAVDLKKDVLIVLNTVRLAVVVFEELEKDLRSKYGDKLAKVDAAADVRGLLEKGKCVLLSLVHGRLPVGVRKRRESVFEVAKRLRKEERDKRWSLVVVATQVAEVGIDYSFDVVITEVAPPTAMVQRLMRGGRVKDQKSEGVVLPIIRTPSMDEEHIYLPYSKELIEHGSRWVRENKLSTELLSDVNFLEKTAKEEFDIISQHAAGWVGTLADKAKKVIEVSKYIPPLATDVHKKILEKFKLRLGEYVALHIVQREVRAHNLATLRGLLREYLQGLSVEKLIEGSVRIGLRLRRRKEEHYVEVPSMAVWALNEYSVIPYVISLRELEVDFIRLKKDESGLYVSEHDDVTSAFGKIVLAQPTLTYSESLGLMEVETYGVYMPKYY